MKVLPHRLRPGTCVSAREEEKLFNRVYSKTAYLCGAVKIGIAKPLLCMLTILRYSVPVFIPRTRPYFFGFKAIHLLTDALLFLLAQTLLYIVVHIYVQARAGEKAQDQPEIYMKC